MTNVAVLYYFATGTNHAMEQCGGYFLHPWAHAAVR